MKKKTRSLAFCGCLGTTAILAISSISLFLNDSASLTSKKSWRSKQEVQKSLNEAISNENDPSTYFEIQNGVVTRFKDDRKIPHNLDLVIRTETASGRVRKIGKHSFSNRSELKSVVLEEGIKVIGQEAFDGCINLETIVLPRGLLEIEAGAFSRCNKLVKIAIPEGVVKVGDHAFRNCKNLQSISIPNSVDFIGRKIFDGCDKLTTQKVLNYSSVLFDWWVNNHEYDVQKLNQMVVIDLANYLNSHNQPFTKIAERAFAGCQALKKIILPEGITSIGNLAFKGCKNLQSVTIPASVKMMGRGIFERCRYLKSYGLTNNSTVLFDWWVREHHYDGKSLSQLDSLDLSNYLNSQNQAFTVIADYAFSKCQQLKKVLLPETISFIGHYAFSQCSNLETTIIPRSVDFIGKKIFEGCQRLTMENVSNDSAVLFDWWFDHFPYNQQSLQKRKIVDLTNYHNSMLLPFTTISDEAITYQNGDQHLVEFVIPESVKKIGQNNFAFASGLKKITILGNNLSYDEKLVAMINQHVNFYVADEQLKTDLLNWGIEASRIVSINKTEHFFVTKNHELVGLTTSGKQQKKLTIPAEIKFVGKETFNGCSQLLENITINANDLSFANDCFANVPKKVNYYVNNDQVSARLQNVGINASQIHVAYGAWLVKASVAGEEVVGVSNYGQTKDTLIIPSSVKRIGEYAFSKGYDSFKRIIFEGDQISLNEHAFVGLNSEVKYCVNNQSLAEELNRKGISLANIGIADGDYFVGANDPNRIIYLTTQGQTKENLVIPAHVDKIDHNAFNDVCRSLEWIKFENQEITLSGNPFANVPQTTKYLVNSKIVGQKLKQININENQITVSEGDLIHEGVDENLKLVGLTKNHGRFKSTIIIPSNVISIGSKALSNCSHELNHLQIDGEDVLLDSQAFKNVPLTVEYYVRNQLMRSRLQAYGISISKINVISGDWITKTAEKQVRLLSLSNQGKTKTKLIIPKDVTHISVDAFNGCDNALKEIVIENQAVEFLNNPFANLAKTINYFVHSAHLGQQLTKLGISPKNITVAENNLIYEGVDEQLRLVGLTEQAKEITTKLVIPESITSIGSKALSECNPNLSAISIEADHALIDEHALSSVPNTTEYYVKNQGMSKKLQNLGINANKINVASGDWWVKKYPGQMELVGLTNQGQVSEYLVIPKNTTRIITDVFKANNQFLKTIAFETNQVEFIGNPFANLAKTIKYYVNSCHFGQRLEKLAIDPASIIVAENNFIYRGVDTKLHLIGLTKNQGQAELNLVIPPNVTSIGPSAFSECNDKLVSISLENDDVHFDENALKNVPSTIEYFVNNQVMSTRLQLLGVHPEKINIVNGDWLIKIHDQQIELVGLTNVGKTKTKLVVPTITTKIGDDAFGGCSPDLANVMIKNSDLDINASALKSLPDKTKFKVFSEVIKHALFDLNINENRISCVKSNSDINPKKGTSSMLIAIIGGSVFLGLLIVSFGIGLSIYLRKRK